MTGIIFNIQRFCLHDGPGIRTTVFMKGCPLRCLWCHNPEGLNQKIQLQYFKDKCIGCGRCRNECECHVFTEQSHQVLFDQCTLCEKCVAKCPSEAISICGQKMTPDELLVKILSDKDFYGTDGGVTFSGGEPLLQADFIVEAARAAKKNGLTVAVDTCGYVPWQSIKKFWM